MEVHAHSHSPHTKWTHYFWEFLMLFLAVFCGFLAEYQLEHKIEKDREKQFVQSLANDLKADINHLNTICNNRNVRQTGLDSLTFFINSPGYKQMGNSIYYHAIYVARIIDMRFTPNDGTMQQLKNAGGLRLIHNRAVVDSITKYDVSTRNLEKLGEIEAELLKEFRSTAARVFNSLVFDKMMDEDNNITRPVDNPALLLFSRTDMDELNFKIHSTKILNRGNKKNAKKLLQQATNLLNTLKSEYHIK